jgi:hypothetical protein
MTRRFYRVLAHQELAGKKSIQYGISRPVSESVMENAGLHCLTIKWQEGCQEFFSTRGRAVTCAKVWES